MTEGYWGNSKTCIPDAGFGPDEKRVKPDWKWKVVGNGMAFPSHSTLIVLLFCTGMELSVQASPHISVFRIGSSSISQRWTVVSQSTPTALLVYSQTRGGWSFFFFFLPAFSHFHLLTPSGLPMSIFTGSAAGVFTYELIVLIFPECSGHGRRLVCLSPWRQGLSFCESFLASWDLCMVNFRSACAETDYQQASVH